jgi:hypothetical protein
VSDEDTHTDITARLRRTDENRGVPICSHAADEIEQLRKERDEARRLLKAVVDMMRDNMAPDATHPKHVCDFIYCPEIAPCMVCENWTDALVMCYPDDFQDEEDKPCQ